MSEFTRLIECLYDESREEAAEQFEPSPEMRAWVEKFAFFFTEKPSGRKPAVFTRCLNGITSQSDYSGRCGLVAIDSISGKYLILEDDFPAIMFPTTANDLYAPTAKGELDCFIVKIPYYDDSHKFWINKVIVYVWYQGDLYELD